MRALALVEDAVTLPMTLRKKTKRENDRVGAKRRICRLDGRWSRGVSSRTDETMD